MKSVNTIASDKKGDVWFAGDRGALYKFSGRHFQTIENGGFMIVGHTKHHIQVLQDRYLL
ncbi:MAG: hypothetical protein ACKOZM_00230 [Flavobacteriales bacterium]